VVLVLIVITRCVAADRLDAPLWGDSYHHTLIAQLLVDNGGLFNSWQPYAEMQSLTYHFGFHGAAAVLHWLGGLAVPKAVVWAGQLLNILAALALYLLALRISDSRWAGVGTLLVAGLLASMPSYYVNWGRYTQLAGQVILPAAIYLTWVVVENQELAIADRRWSVVGGRWSLADWRFFILSWIALAGLALAHYRVLIFVVLFFPALFLLQLGRQPLLGVLTRMAVVCGGALLALPWFARLIGCGSTRCLPRYSRSVSTTRRCWPCCASAASLTSILVSARDESTTAARLCSIPSNCSTAHTSARSTTRIAYGCFKSCNNAEIIPARCPFVSADFAVALLL
jgi:hypothetical protein